MAEARETLKAARRWVIKIGSALLTHEGLGLKRDTLDTWVSQIV